MIDKVLCPYCGGEMEVVSGYRMGSLAWVACARCTQKGCDALGPRVEGFDTSVDAEAAALAAAQARYLPPNRPLTLDEVKAMERDDMGYAIAWTENRRDEENHPWPYVEADCVPKFAEYFEDYGKEYRVWLRKPTQAEMDAARWGGGANND